MLAAALQNERPGLMAALRRSVVGEGEPGRLLRVLQDAEEGRPVTLVGIGASLTGDYGGIIGYNQDQHALSYIGGPDECRGSCVRPGWLLSFGQYLAGTVPLNQSNVTVVNVGRPGHALGTYVPCMSSKIPTTANLVVFEGAVERP